MNHINVISKKRVGVFLDDERYPVDVKWIDYPDDIEWVLARNFKDFQDVVQELGNLVEVFSFDHDLQDFCEVFGVERTGKTCIDWYATYAFTEKLKKLPEVYFHTMNPVGKENMKSYWNQLKDYL